jgi:hypothetical protein
MDAHYSVFKTPFYKIGTILAKTGAAGPDIKISQRHEIQGDFIERGAATKNSS